MSSPQLIALADLPPALAEIPEPPATLWLAGQWPEPTFHLLTVVGSRRLSHYGREVCESLISGLTGQPIAIISGLALGVDTVAHQSALTARLPTIAFPGSGLDPSVLHPPSNRRLAEEIVAAGGALVSEFPLTYPAGLHTFPKRNRLMAGVAEAVLIIEAGEKSGTLITARLALDYNREVLAVPGSIFNGGSVGTNRLIRQGATPITSSHDILEVFGLSSDEANEHQRSFEFSQLSPSERRVVDCLALEALPRDELIRALALSTSEANSLLGLLELKGLIKEVGGEIRLY